MLSSSSSSLSSSLLLLFLARDSFALESVFGVVIYLRSDDRRATNPFPQYCIACLSCFGFSIYSLYFFSLRGTRSHMYITYIYIPYNCNLPYDCNFQASRRQCYTVFFVMKFLYRGDFCMLHHELFIDSRCYFWFVGRAFGFSAVCSA